MASRSLKPMSFNGCHQRVLLDTQLASDRGPRTWCPTLQSCFASARACEKECRLEASSNLTTPLTFFLFFLMTPGIRGSRSLRFKNIARGGHRQPPRAKKKRSNANARQREDTSGHGSLQVGLAEEARSPGFMHVHPYCRLRPERLNPNPPSQGEA